VTIVAEGAVDTAPNVIDAQGADAFDPIVLDAARDMYKARNTRAGSQPWRLLESQHPELAELASKHTGKRTKVQYTPATRPRIEYPKSERRPTKIGHSLFDPWLVGMSRLAFYQHQVFPDIHIGKKPKAEPEWALPVTLGEQRRSFKAWEKSYPDDPLSDEIPPKVRRELYAGKRAPDAEKVTIRVGFWHPDTEAKWSTKRLYCAVPHCGQELPEERWKYCSDDHARLGSNEVRRNTTARKKARNWPVDENGWYVQTPPPVRRRWRVHTYSDYESQVRQTVSRDYRLRAPWAGEPNAWRVMKLTTESGRLAS
jgi:hypothetical protein